MPSSNNNASLSHYERKLARQRQLELMEAAASGTAPSMQLDTSTLSPLSSGSNEDASLNRRARNAETARRFLHEEDEDAFVPQTIPLTRGSSEHTARRGGGENVFRRDARPTTRVNLMDHVTGVYTTSDSNSLWSRLQRFLAGATSTSGVEHDAVPQVEDDWKRPARVSPVAALCHNCWSHPRRRTVVCVLTGALFVIMGMSLSYHFFSQSHANRVYRENDTRLDIIKDHLIYEGISHPRIFDDMDSPEHQALRWIAFSDPARLDPLDPLLLQRYALAVFYYQSYHAFQKVAGKQKPIEVGLEGKHPLQMEGVPNPGWTRSDYWMTERGICDWFGVECVERNIDGDLLEHYNDNDRVTSLNLTKNHVYGTIPPEFRALDSLMSLDLSHNHLVGNIPDPVTRLFDLQYIFLNDNQISGQLPESIGFLESARYILLHNNHLTGTLPTETNHLYQLSHLQLDHNQLSGDIPDVSQCRRLQRLYLNHNRFEGYFPFSLARSTSLELLHLQNNQLQGSLPPEMESLSHLEYFAVNGNRLNGGIVSHLFSRLTNLREILLYDNAFTGSLPHSAGDLTNLRVLQVHNNRFNGDIPKEWDGQMHNMEILHMYNNTLDGTIPAIFGTMTNLKELWINHNTFTGTVPKQLGSMTNLETLFLDQNKLSGPLPKELGKLTKLESLRVDRNQITGTMPDEVCKLRDKELSLITADCKRKVQCTCCNKCT
jgi:Leucine-rich repeat (LRR) protein